MLMYNIANMHNASSRYNKKLFQSTLGFTIVELLVVIVVIGTIATLAIVSYVGVSRKASSASIQADLANADRQLELFKTQSPNAHYPLANECPNASSDNICITGSSGNNVSYIVDPSDNRSYCIEISNASDSSISYYIDNTNNQVMQEGNCPGPPVLDSPSVADVTSSAALLGANISDPGDGTITERGVCWGTSPHPTNNCSNDGLTSTGIYSVGVTGMSPGTTIYYRGYATSDIGTGYSSDDTFITIDGMDIQPDATAGKDTFYGTSYVTGGGPTSDTMRTGGWGDWYYSYVEFDLTGSPTAANTASAYLWVWCYVGPVNNPNIDLYRVTSAWTETGVTSASHPTVTYYSETPATPLDSTYRWQKIDVTSLYQDWKNSVYPNYGVQFHATSNNNARAYYYTSDNTDAYHRPKLVITAI
jgi:prepilin-type N-terminal cleavage/methylation domain-containing protein